MGTDLDKAKLNAAKKALDYVVDAEIIGVGTGSTVEKFIDLLGGMKERFSKKLFVASSIDTMIKLRKYGFNVLHTAVVSDIDVYVDGADEVDKELNMIKGGGAALTMEKLLTFFSRKRIFIVDYTKLVNKLCEKHPIPIDVLPEAVSMVYGYLVKKNYNPVIRYPLKGKYGPVVSDVRGVIIDIKPTSPFNPIELERELKSIPGVIETGLFIGLADIVIIGYEDKVEELTKH